MGRSKNLFFILSFRELPRKAARDLFGKSTQPRYIDTFGSISYATRIFKARLWPLTQHVALMASTKQSGALARSIRSEREPLIELCRSNLSLPCLGQKPGLIVFFYGAAITFSYCDIPILVKTVGDKFDVFKETCKCQGILRTSLERQRIFKHAFV